MYTIEYKKDHVKVIATQESMLTKGYRYVIFEHRHIVGCGTVSWGAKGQITEGDIKPHVDEYIADKAGRSS